MNYNELKLISKNFAGYCYEGKLTFVKKWIDDPNVDINWNYHTALRNAVEKSHLDIIDLLLNHPKLNTKYHEAPELSGSIGEIDLKINPFTQAIIDKNYTVLDMFIASKKFKIDRLEHLNILKQMKDEEMNDYFRNQEGIFQMILDNNDTYSDLLPKTAKDVFLF